MRAALFYRCELVWIYRQSTLIRQPNKMVKHNQTIRRLLPTNCWSVFDYYVGLLLKELKYLLGSGFVKNLILSYRYWQIELTKIPWHDSFGIKGDDPVLS